MKKAEGKQVLHFLHVRKTGGTAFRYAIKRYKPDNKFAIFLHDHFTRLSDIPKSDQVIFFLRDPISRFVSGFYSRQREGRPRFYNPWSPKELIAFQEFDTPNQLAIALSAQDHEVRRKAQQAMKNIEHVNTSYWHWFKDEKYFISRISNIFFIGFQENLSQDFERLRLIIGCSDNAKLPTDDIKAHRNPKNIDKNLEERAIINLKIWYKKDFEFINLCKRVIKNNQIITMSNC